MPRNQALMLGIFVKPGSVAVWLAAATCRACRCHRAVHILLWETGKHRPTAGHQPECSLQGVEAAGPGNQHAAALIRHTADICFCHAQRLRPTPKKPHGLAEKGPHSRLAMERVAFGWNEGPRVWSQRTRRDSFRRLQRGDLQPPINRGVTHGPLLLGDERGKLLFPHAMAAAVRPLPLRWPPRMA